MRLSFVILVVTLCVINFTVSGKQNNHYKSQQTENISADSQDDNEVKYPNDVDSTPQYPGGIGVLVKDIVSNVKYPESAKNQGIKGRCTLKFVVKKDGTVGEILVQRSLSPDFDEAAIKAVKNLPKKFMPGLKDGKPVNVWYVVHVKFKK